MTARPLLHILIVKKRKRVKMKTINLQVVVLLSVLLICCAREKEDTFFTVGIMQISENTLLDRARLKTVEALKDEGFDENLNIQIIYKNAQCDISNIPVLANYFLNSKVDMVLTIGTPCMIGAIQVIRKIPVVYTVSCSPEQVGMRDNFDNLSGIYDPFNFEVFIDLIEQSVEKLDLIGIVYNPSEANAEFAAKKLKQVCTDRDIGLIAKHAYSTNDVFQASQALALKKVNCFAVAADNTVSMSINSMIKVAEAEKIPVFVTDPSLIHSGACAGIGADYELWGYESGKVAAKIIKGESPAQTAQHPVSRLSLMLNIAAAEKQGAVFPQSLIDTADVVIK